MAVAPFFSKAALSAAQILGGVSQSDFLARVSAARITVVFGDDTAACSEGRVAAEMTVNLLARLFPSLALWAHGTAATKFRDQLQTLAQSINPLLELEIEPWGTGDGNAFQVVLGKVESGTAPSKIHVGSSGWTAYVSTSSVYSFGRSGNPFGAAAAGCIAVANVFRHVFKDSLPEAGMDQDLALSINNYDQPGSEAPLGSIDLAEVHLAGAGAIGNAVIWTLARVSGLRGNLHIVDPESVELSNLQRYILTDFTSPEKAKVEIASEHLSGSELTVHGHQTTWGGYLAQRGDYRIALVAVALDSARDRIDAQGCLPRRMVNAWTQRDNLGVSRHFHFGTEPCLACLYLPDGTVPNEDEEILHALKLPAEELMKVRVLLHLGTPIDRDFITRVAKLANQDPEVLEPFIGQPLRVLYSGAVCGGLLLDLNGPAMPAADVPMPFQSALAGVMLAAELMQAKSGRQVPTTTTLNLLRPIPPYLSFPRPMRDKCFCQDPAFTRVYNHKWHGSNQT